MTEIEQVKERSHDRELGRRQKYAAMVGKLVEGKSLSKAEQAALDTMLMEFSFSPDDLRKHIEARQQVIDVEKHVAAGKAAGVEYRTVEAKIIEFNKRFANALRAFDIERAQLGGRSSELRGLITRGLWLDGKADELAAKYPHAFGIAGDIAPRIVQREKSLAELREENDDAVDRSTAASLAASLRDDPGAEAFLGNDARALLLKARERGWVKLGEQPPKQERPPFKEKTHIESIAEQNLYGRADQSDKRPFPARLKDEVARLEKPRNI